MPTKKTLEAALLEIYQTCDNERMICLLRVLAEKLREAHDKHIVVNPLNNQTIVIAFDAHNQIQNVSFSPECAQTQSLHNLTVQARGENLAAINLPDDYWRIFKHMYFNDGVVPAAFNQVIEAKQVEIKSESSISPQNIWLWDEKSAQAMIVLHSRSKKQFRKKWDAVKLAWRVLAALPKVFFTYKKLLRSAYQQPICLRHKVGVALHPAYWQEEKKLLQELGSIPVLIRFYAHETEPAWDVVIAQIQELHQLGHQVVVALVQDRKSLLEMQHWQQLLDYVLPAIHDYVTWVEVGHATNRVKWGIWTAADYVRLAKCVASYTQHYPNLHLVGPAVIDFEWYRLLDFLKALPKHLKFFAVSQHLYVDRRGAPENFQGKFSTLEKCAMGKAIANTSRHSDNRFIISEFNWPLKNTGIYSPIGSPYTAPEWFSDLPGETEETYANYLIRYLAITLCSGFVDQAFIWRLSAHGYGLVDDLDNFRKRSAFLALKTFLKILGDAQFIKRWTSNKKNYLLEFQQNDQRILLAWAIDENQSASVNVEYKQAIDILGKVSSIKNQLIKLTSSPCYYWLI